MIALTPEEWVVWGYRILLGRDPENSAVIRAYTDDGFSPDALRRRLVGSAEFAALSGLPDPPAATTPEQAELQQLKAAFTVPAPPSVPGAFVDFLGVQTRCSYLPPNYAVYAGQVEGPDTEAVPLHEPAETIAMLRAVQDGTGLLTVAELGAGWGPWLVAGAAAARQRNRPIRLVGVEGDPGHLDFMRTHMRDNGIDPDAHRLLHAVVGATDGTAAFPILPDPSADWGARADFTGAPAQATHVEVTAVSIRTALDGIDRVDIMHVDIQGSEADALEASADTLDRVVRRLVIGTHGRALEERLLTLLSARGWLLEHEKACTFHQAGTAMVLLGDGVQVWSNPALA